MSIPLFPCFFNHKGYFKNIKYGYCQFPVIVISPNCSDFKVKIGNFFPLPIAIRGHFEKVTTLFTYCAGSILQGFSLSISHMWILKKKERVFQNSLQLDTNLWWNMPPLPLLIAPIGNEAKDTKHHCINFVTKTKNAITLWLLH